MNSLQMLDVHFLVCLDYRKGSSVKKLDVLVEFLAA